MLKGKVKKGIWVELNSWINFLLMLQLSVFGTGGNINKTHKLLGIRVEINTDSGDGVLKEKLKSLTRRTNETYRSVPIVLTLLFLL